MFQSMKKAVVLAGVVLILAAPSFAQSHHGKGGDGPCKADIEKFCKDVPKGGGAVMKCLKEHQSELSPACQEKGKEMKEHFKEVKKACKDDVKKLCPGVKAGHGAIMKCLKENEDKVSPGCKDAMTSK